VGGGISFGVCFSKGVNFTHHIKMVFLSRKKEGIKGGVVLCSQAQALRGPKTKGKQTKIAAGTFLKKEQDIENRASPARISEGKTKEGTLCVRAITASPNEQKGQRRKVPRRKIGWNWTKKEGRRNPAIQCFTKPARKKS